MDDYDLERKTRRVGALLESQAELGDLLRALAPAFPAGARYVDCGGIYDQRFVRFSKADDGRLTAELIPSVRASDLKAPAAPPDLEPGGPTPERYKSRTGRRLGGLVDTPPPARESMDGGTLVPAPQYPRLGSFRQAIIAATPNPDKLGPADMAAAFEMAARTEAEDADLADAMRDHLAAEAAGANGAGR